MTTIWIGAVYIAALWVMGVPLWKCIIVGVIVGVSSYLRFGRRWLSRGAFILMVIGVGMWLELVPTPGEWLDTVRHIKTAIAN